MPCYACDGPVGVVHLGLGAFHSAHQALVFDALLRRGDTRWGVLGVAMRNTALADALAVQDGLYAVQVASGSGVRWQVSGAVLPTDTRLLPVGGITPENMHRYLAAGASGFGIGSTLYKSGMTANQVQGHAMNFISAYRAASLPH